MKNGGSLSAKEVSRTSLLDFSNHLSALLLSPELFLPNGARLDGESLLPAVAREPVAGSSLEESLASLTGVGGFVLGEWRRDTERWAGGRRGWDDDEVCACSGGVITIIG